jgi:hypothetical protein
MALRACGRSIVTMANPSSISRSTMRLLSNWFSKFGIGILVLGE